MAHGVMFTLGWWTSKITLMEEDLSILQGAHHIFADHCAGKGNHWSCGWDSCLICSILILLEGGSDATNICLRNFDNFNSLFVFERMGLTWSLMCF